MSRDVFDIVIVGGGILGCATALRLAQHGMRVALVEQHDLGQGASGVNAGTLSLQIKRVKLMPYALKGHALWASFGDQVGFRQTGGLTLAFTKDEAELLHQRMQQKAQAGAPIRFLNQQEIAEKEPALTDRVVAASWCPSDGFANSSLTGHFYRQQLIQAGVTLREQFCVTSIEHPNETSFVTHSATATVHSKRILLACGGWLQQAASLLNVALPVQARVNTVSVTERIPPLLNHVVGHATGLLTMKQKSNGSILIGGGWQGEGHPDTGKGRIVAKNLLNNLNLAQYVLPKLAHVRVLRSWTGFEANVPDFYPLAGVLPGYRNAFVLGCVRGGYTIGPFIGQLMGDFIHGIEPELPLFDPARDFTSH